MTLKPVVPTERELKKLKGGPAGFSLLFDSGDHEDPDLIIGWFMDIVPMPEDLPHWHFYAKAEGESFNDENPHMKCGYFNAEVPDTSTMEITNWSATGFKNKKQGERIAKFVNDNPLILLAESKNNQEVLIEEYSERITKKLGKKIKVGAAKDADDDDQPTSEVKPKVRRKPARKVELESDDDVQSARKPRARKAAKPQARAAKKAPTKASA